MPGPQAPNMSTIGHLMSPIVDDLLAFEGPINIPTSNFPEGCLIETRLLTLIGDSGARHKVGKFALHLENYMCPWCMIRDTDLSKVKLGPLRVGAEVKEMGEKWKKASKNQRMVLMRTNGVQFSELNQLTYRDPVNHMAIGIMHNWMEGILAHHFRERWGFQELEYYQTKQRMAQTQRYRNPKRPRIGEREDEEAEVEDMESDSGDGEDGGCDHDIRVDEGEKGGLFTREFRQLFRDKMKGMVLPEDLGSLPKDLGSPKHGKLKAMQWHTLWVYAIPLVILEMFVEDVEDIKEDSNRFAVLQNTSLLVRCTNLLTSMPLRLGTGRKFTKSYQKYQQSSKELFRNFKVQPNHHYALHVEEQMRLFGPLSGVAEYWGERLIGILQNLNTNERFGDMELTMITKIISQQRLKAKAPLEKHLAQHDKETAPKQRTHMHIEGGYYEMLLESIRFRSEAPIQSRYLRPYVLSKGPILTGRCFSKQSYSVPDGPKVTPMKPHNCVMYRHNNQISYGLITEILQFDHPLGHQDWALAINPIRNCYAKDLNSPTRTFQFLCYMMKVVIGQILDTRLFIHPNEIGCLMAYRYLAYDTFNIPSNGIIMVPVDKLAHLLINEDSTAALF
ncbi:hypothetical protein O181_069541 [Austropuccinia psidii MF-1]|uniref:Uncharacterized protein n=1 Tax=Austropuccinia psidii MF-1 TaxID=1389203 RepID=A0A9Q3I4W3_9BASI|nr:hypothetical protein [Austropuccinia psidii MF-1]